MPNLHQAFFHRDKRRFTIVNCNVEDGTSNRDDGCRRVDPVIIRLPSEPLDVNFDASKDQIKQIFQIGRIRTEDHSRVRINLKGTSIRHLKNRKPVGSREE